MKISKTQDAAERKQLSDQIKQIFSAAKSATGTTPGSLNPFAKDYADMKMAYCATNPSTAKVLCSTAASRFTSTTKAGGFTSTPSSAIPSSTSLAMEWYCAKQGNGGLQENICKRAGILKEMRTATSTDARKGLTDQLKQYPAAPYGTMQAIYADFCKLKTSATTPLCLSMRRTAESKQMNKWYCGQPEHKEGLWCQRTALLDKIQKISPTPDSAQAEERKQLSAQMAALMKPTPGIADSPSKKLSAEISAAKKVYCAAHPDIAYCKPPAPSAAAAP